MDAGGLVDDGTMIAIVRERLSRPDTPHGFVLDGFPRTVGQAEALDGIMDERGNGPLVVVDVVVPEEELVRRLGSRRICEVRDHGRAGCRLGKRAGARSAAASWCRG